MEKEMEIKMSIHDALDTLNPMQREAAVHTEGPLLILAGAGSGKTRVLTHRIAYLMEEKGVNPGNILAITFTNKAASEMRERVNKIAGMGAESVWVSTFHSACVRILRRHIEVLGFGSNFTIYDADDQKTVMKEIFRKFEYQDTNTAQFKFVSLLAEKYKNLCVVGDDDQSIYRFRGANIGNILGFEKVFPEAKVVRLEQNYRSTQNILNAANEVIVNNTERKEKRLWTENEEGDKVHFRQFNNGFEEAEYVAGEIIQGRRNGKFQYKDCAVLYRTNAQSRLFEEKFLLANVPYKIVGGVNFYARKEIKDLLSYLKTIDNASDDLAVRRILNVPKRGIGLTSIGRVQDYADMMNLSFYDALRVVEEVPSIGRAAGKINDFVSFIQGLKSKAEAYTVRETLEEVIELTGYVKELEAEKTEEAQARIENIDELISKTESFQEAMEEAGQPATLSAFLEEIALVADIDSVDPDQDYVLLMTLHSAKGLEFPNVFIVGMEDGVFPGYASIWSGDPSDIEEERRLCYVGITRAMKELTLTCAKQRMIRGETQYNRVSRFVREVPRELVDLGHTIQEKKPRVDDIVSPKSVYAQMKMNFQAKSTLQKKDFTVKKADSLDYGEGDTVRHVKFGVGIVKNIADGGRDYEVTVDFDKVGVKKMFAGFAKLKKI